MFNWFFSTRKPYQSRTVLRFESLEARELPAVGIAPPILNVGQTSLQAASGVAIQNSVTSLLQNQATNSISGFRDLNWNAATRFRGFNITAPRWSFPDEIQRVKDAIPDLAKSGVNLVRFSFDAAADGTVVRPNSEFQGLPGKKHTPPGRAELFWDIASDPQAYSSWLKSNMIPMLKEFLPLFKQHGIGVIVSQATAPGALQNPDLPIATQQAALKKIYQKDPAFRNAFIEGWNEVSRQIRSDPNGSAVIAYDLLNEPQPDNSVVGSVSWKTIAEQVTSNLRKNGDQRTVVVEPKYGDIRNLGQLAQMFKLSDTNAVYSVHIYPRMLLTDKLQTANRIRTPIPVNDATPLTPAQMKVVIGQMNQAIADFKTGVVRQENVFETARRWQVQNRARIYVGEFSSWALAPGFTTPRQEDRDFIQTAIKLFDTYGWDWAFLGFTRSPYLDNFWNPEIDPARMAILNGQVPGVKGFKQNTWRLPDTTIHRDAEVSVAAPVNLRTTSITPTSIGLQWDDRSTNETEFRISMSRDGGATWANIGGPDANTTRFTVTNLTPNTRYLFKVRAANSEGYSDYSNTIDLTTSAEVPVAPGNLRVSNVTSRTIDLTWDDRSGNETGFRIAISHDGGASWDNVGVVNANVGQFRVENLNPNTRYLFKVRAAFGSVYSDYSNTIDVTTSLAIRRDSPAVYRNGQFIFDTTEFGYQSTDPTGQYGGFAGDIPVTGDWDGDGFDQPGIFRIQNGQAMFVLDTGAPGWQPTDVVIPFGLPGDVPVIGDWDGDGKDNVGIFRIDPNAHVPYFALDIGAAGYQSSDPYFQFGLVGDLAVAGDWDGDGKDNVGVYRVESTTKMGYFALDSGVIGWQPSDPYFQFGLAGDIPIAGDWDGDGKDNVGIFRMDSNANMPYFALDVGPLGWQMTDPYFQFGLPPGDIPLAGRWRA